VDRRRGQPCCADLLVPDLLGRDTDPVHGFPASGGSWRR
jgi:hypothetical protein